MKNIVYLALAVFFLAAKANAQSCGAWTPIQNTGIYFKSCVDNQATWNRWTVVYNSYDFPVLVRYKIFYKDGSNSAECDEEVKAKSEGAQPSTGGRVPDRYWLIKKMYKGNNGQWIEF